MATTATDQCLFDAAKALFLHNAVLGFEVEADDAEAAWMLDEKVQAFWLEQAVIAAEVLVP